MQSLVQEKSNKNYIFEVCVCKLMYPACNVYAPYCHLWLYNIFQHCLINGTILGKNVMEDKMCVLIFSTTLV